MAGPVFLGIIILFLIFKRLKDIGYLIFKSLKKREKSKYIAHF